MLVTNCGGDAFVVNDASCISNSICSSQFLDNLGGLSQSHTNPMSVRDLVERDAPATISATTTMNPIVEPVIRQSAAPSADGSLKKL
jgi:hypothetical protein